MSTSGRTYPFMLAMLIIGAVVGFLSGMAQANAFTRDLVTLLLMSIAGAVLFGGVLGAIGWFIDQSRYRRRVP